MHMHTHDVGSAISGLVILLDISNKRLNPKLLTFFHQHMSRMACHRRQTEWPDGLATGDISFNGIKPQLMKDAE